MLIALFAVACNKDNDVIPVVSVEQLEVNPSGYSPLTARYSIVANEPVSVTLTLEGKADNDPDLIVSFDGRNTSWTLPIYGLYADHANQIRIELQNESGEVVDVRSFTINTQRLADLPDIRIDRNATTLQPHHYLVNYFGFRDGGNPTPQRPFIMDQNGNIRWYLDFANHPSLSNLFFDNGLNILANGNFIMGDGNSGALYEVDRFGEVINRWSLQGYGFHHHVIEIPNGNFLVTVNDPAKTTVEDVIIEIDRASGAITTTWDLNESLDNQRRVWETDLADLDIDWFHANAIEYDAANDEIIVSGRTQGVVKLDRDNHVTWILAPHKGWSNNLDPFLLTPLDQSGSTISDPMVLEGDANHPDFEWSWYQHSPILLPNGNLMIFDNGDNRNYNTNVLYSRAVEYAIDESSMTIQQAWEYGKIRGDETYSRIVSKVNYYPSDGNVLFTPGAVVDDGIAQGKIIDLNQSSGQVEFEATVFPPQPLFIIAFHNAQRVTLYP